MVAICCKQNSYVCARKIRRITKTTLNTAEDALLWKRSMLLHRSDFRLEYFFIFERAFARHNVVYRHVSKEDEKNVGNKMMYARCRRIKRWRIYVMPTVKESASNTTVYVEIMQRKKVRASKWRRNERGDIFWMRGTAPSGGRGDG